MACPATNRPRPMRNPDALIVHRQARIECGRYFCLQHLILIASARRLFFRSAGEKNAQLKGASATCSVLSRRIVADAKG